MEPRNGGDVLLGFTGEPPLNMRLNVNFVSLLAQTIGEEDEEEAEENIRGSILPFVDAIMQSLKVGGRGSGGRVRRHHVVLPYCYPRQQTRGQLEKHQYV